LDDSQIDGGLADLTRKWVAMKPKLKSAMLAGALLLTVATFARAQIQNELTFETTFPFYAGNAKMPAGSYKVTPMQGPAFLLLIEDTSGSRSMYLEFSPTHADNPHPQTDVTFNNYGKLDFLNQLWIQGQTYGMQILPGKAEEIAAKNATVKRHSLPGKSGG